METPIKIDLENHKIYCLGNWNLATLTQLQDSLQNTQWPSSGDFILDGSKITGMDSAGAWLILSSLKKSTKKNLNYHLENFSEQHQNLLSIVQNKLQAQKATPEEPQTDFLERLGKNTIIALQEFRDFLTFTGKLTIQALQLLFHPKKIRWNALFGTLDKAGYQALPIIALLSFMIGVVLAYQMGVQLRNYGANVFVVDLLGLSVLREFGPLLTAIMIAGRTGSAFTAQLGIMKINQEVDALDTMGVTSGELLLLPRIFGLVIAMPLLTIWADMFGVFGGMVMSNNMLHITYTEFLHRFHTNIPLKSLIIGLGKAPVFALIISSIGCFEGMRVKGNADSVGRNTTRSVVLSIFFIIVVDALFSVILSRWKL